MMKPTLAFVLFFIAAVLDAQTVNIDFITRLDPGLAESSGIIGYKGYLWTINDSGNKAQLYAMDENGRIITTVDLSNATNIDWEDIAQDKHAIYIADTGNNNGHRKSFTIYRIDKEQLNNTAPAFTVKALPLEFTYENQPDTLQAYAHDFDAEALICVEGQLGIFTKNWASGNTHFYLIDTSQKRARLVHTFPSYGLVTGADYDPANRKVFLVGYQTINMQFFPFLCSIDDFTLSGEGQFQRYQATTIPGHQTESICLTPKGLFITNETTKTNKATLWSVQLPE